MQITHATNNFFFMIWKISPPLDRKGHATMFTEHLIIILKIIKNFYSASLNEEFVTNHFSFAYIFFSFPSFTIIACVTCLFESHSYNKEKYAHKWPVDCTRHHKFFFCFSLKECAIYLFILCKTALVIVRSDLSRELVKKKLYRSMVLPFTSYKLNYLWEVTARKI